VSAPYQIEDLISRVSSVVGWSPDRSKQQVRSTSIHALAALCRFQLGGAVVIWPLLSKLLERVLIDRTLNHQWTAFYPFTLVERGQMTLGSLVTSLALFQQLIGVCLLLIAVLYLSKTKTPSPLS
jgi:hypothetical protein